MTHLLNLTLRGKVVNFLRQEERESMGEVLEQQSNQVNVNEHNKEFKEEGILNTLSLLSRLIKNYKNSVCNFSPTEKAINELQQAILEKGRAFKACVAADTL